MKFIRQSEFILNSTAWKAPESLTLGVESCMHEQIQSHATYQVGVIVPTYNRSKELLICLKCLENQTISDFEVIVVDDGSTDSTAQEMERYLQDTPLNIRYVRQSNAGPAKARNLAINMLRSPICILIGDDIFPTPSFLEAHLQLHRERPGVEIVGLGLTKWSEVGQKVTKFMRWLEESGNQFAYADLLAGVAPTWNHFYTSNLSLKTALLCQFPFNETFPNAAMEDMELGYRIQQEFGLKMVFLANALAYHLHPTDFRRACKRMLTVGPSAKHMYEIWPDSAPKPPGILRQWTFGIFLNQRWLLRGLVSVSDLLVRVWCPNPLMKIALKVHYLIGYSTPR